MDAYLGAPAGERDQRGHRLVVRNGYGAPAAGDNRGRAAASLSASPPPSLEAPVSRFANLNQRRGLRWGRIDFLRVGVSGE